MAVVICSGLKVKSVLKALYSSLVEFLNERLASYCVSRKHVFVHEIPKSAMEKVSKKALAKMFSK